LVEQIEPHRKARLKEGILLHAALRLESGAVVSFVGAGGKTTAMFRLAAELAQAGRRVVITTTTRIFETQARRAPSVLAVNQLGHLTERLDRYGQCCVIGIGDRQGKTGGVSCEAVAGLQARPDVDIVLVEADGSRLLPLKAPAGHEPVIPSVTTHLIPVAGLDVINQPLDSEHVHRAEFVAALCGASLGNPVTPGMVVKVLAHPNGGAKLRPAHARLVPMINKAESEAALRHARSISHGLLAASEVDEVIVSSLHAERPVREVWTRTAAVVLAAGESRRFGSPKQLLGWGDTTLVAHVAGIALDAGLDPVLVVTGYEADRVSAAVAGLRVTPVYNPDFAAGQGTSVSRGVAALPLSAGAAVFLLADQPGVSAGVVHRVLRAHRATLAPIVLPEYEGRRGNPALFDASLFGELRMLTGDVGGRALFEKYAASVVRVPVNDPAALQDIDTPEEYVRACECVKNKSRQ
jgi:molybdenum cofactor cytidylyltransferase